jgi:hypothetical protein
MGRIADMARHRDIAGIAEQTLVGLGFEGARIYPCRKRSQKFGLQPLGLPWIRDSG